MDSMDMSLSKLREIVKDKEAWHATVHAVSKSQTWLSDWTTVTTAIKILFQANEIVYPQIRHEVIFK